MSHHKASGPGIVISYARATPDMCEDAVVRLAKASTILDQVTPEMESVTSSTANLWHDVG